MSGKSTERMHKIALVVITKNRLEALIFLKLMIIIFEVSEIFLGIVFLNVTLTEAKNFFNQLDGLFILILRYKILFLHDFFSRISHNFTIDKIFNLVRIFKYELFMGIFSILKYFSR